MKYLGTTIDIKSSNKAVASFTSSRLKRESSARNPGSIEYAIKQFVA
jgi:hypothetical protein